MRKRLTRRVALAGIATGIGGAAWAARRGGVPGVAPPPTPNFTGLSLTNYTWTTSGAAVTIGALVPTADNGGDVTGSTVTVAGPNSADFQFTNGGVIPCAFQAKAGVTAGAYPDLTIEITKSGIGNSPYTSAPFTVTGSASSGQIALVRTVNNAGAGTPAIAFWNLGHPFIDGDVPTGSIVSAKLGGTTVPVQGFSTKLHADGSMAWSDLHVDLSGAMPGPAASADLVLSVVAGSWSTTTNRTDADWSALIDTVEITNLSMYQGSISSITWSGGVATMTTSAPHGIPLPIGGFFTDQIRYLVPVTSNVSSYNGNRNCIATDPTTLKFNLGTDPGASAVSGTYGVASASDLNGAGTWIATFDEAATGIIIWPYGSGALGLRRRVTAPFYNGVTKHRFLMAVMEYWCTQKGDGTAGPVMSIGPVIENCLIFKTSPNQFNYDIAFKRNGSTIRSETGVPHIASSKAVLTRLDGLGDWSSDDPSIWVSQNYNLVGATFKLPNYAPGINYTGPGATDGAYPPPAVTGLSTTTGIFSIANTQALFGSSGKRANPVAFTAGTIPTGLTAGAKYWAAKTGLVISASHSGGVATLTTDVAHGFPTSSTATLVVRAMGNYNGTFTCTFTTSTQFTYALGGSLAPLTQVGSYELNNQFRVYDNVANALLFGAAGLIIPSTSGASVVTHLSAGPTATGVLCQGQGNPGSFADICVIPEWHAAYVVGNTQSWQRLGRVQMWAWLSAPVWVLKDDTPDLKPHIVSCLSTALTPVALRPAKSTARWADGQWNNWSTDINGGYRPFGGLNDWAVELSHTTNPVFVPWLLEGGAIFQQICVENGARCVGEDNGTARRNATIAGTAYNGLSAVLYQNVDPRAGPWAADGIGIGAFAASTGSDDETLLYNVLQQNVSAMLAYMTFEDSEFGGTGVHYTDTGSTCYYEATYPPETATTVLTKQTGVNEPNFMFDYGRIVWPFIANLNGDRVTGMDTLAAYYAKNIVNAYNGSWGYYATSYRKQICISDASTALPAVYADVTKIGVTAGDACRWSLDPVTGTITINSTCIPSFGILDGDKFRPCNYPNVASGSTHTWPTPFTDEVEYFFVNVNIGALTCQLAATEGGAAIVPSKGDVTRTGFTCVAGSKILLTSDTSAIISAGPNDSIGAVVTSSAPGTIAAGSRVMSIVTNVSVTLDLAVIGVGVAPGDSLSFKGPFYSGFFVPTQHGNPNTGTMAATGTGEDSYLATQIGALALAADRGVSGADTAYNSAVSGSVGALPRYTGNNNVEAMWAIRRVG